MVSKFKTYFILFVVMMIWGFNVIAIKILVDTFSPVTITAFRILTAGIVVLIVLWKTDRFIQLKIKEILWVVLAGLTGIFGHHFFLATGLTQTTASNAGLILGLVPLMTALFAMVFLGEKFTIIRLLGVILGLLGVSFIVLSGSSQIGKATLGDMLVFLAVVTQAISFVFVKKATSTMSSKTVTGFMQIVGAIFLFLFSLVLEPNGTDTLDDGNLMTWIVFFASAILATGVGHMLYNNAVHHLGAGETAIFINLTPFFSLTGAVFFLKESIHMFQLLGFVLIVLGVLLGTGAFEKSKRKKIEYKITE
jgi:drug/metabolite transporter (DMT)-like permease